MLGNDWLSFAQRYLLAAHILFRQAYGVNQPISDGPVDTAMYLPLIHPIGYLTGHAIELLLKNNIAKQGADERYLKFNVGHDLRFAFHHDANTAVLNVIPQACAQAYAKLTTQPNDGTDWAGIFFEHFENLPDLFSTQKGFAYKYPNTSHDEQALPRPIFIITVFETLVEKHSDVFL